MQIIKPLFIFLLAITFVSCGTAEKQEANATPEATEEAKVEEVRSYTVNTENSQVQWKGSILSVKDHEGTINFESGKFTTQGEKLMEGTFVVDMSTMVATDENYQPEEGKTKEQLIGHLSSPDFFDVAKFPKAILTVVGGNATLTVRGHAKGVELSNVTMSPNGDNVNATAEFTFNRQDFGVAFDMGVKDMAISDEIVAKVSIDGVKS